jgi:hypothetical protein
MYKKWCNRCNRYHDSPPLDENKLIEKHAREIALEIDRQVIESIQGCNSSIRDLKKDKKDDRGVK